MISSATTDCWEERAGLFSSSQNKHKKKAFFPSVCGNDVTLLSVSFFASSQQHLGLISPVPVVTITGLQATINTAFYCCWLAGIFSDFHLHKLFAKLAHEDGSHKCHVHKMRGSYQKICKTCYTCLNGAHKSVNCCYCKNIFSCV